MREQLEGYLRDRGGLDQGYSLFEEIAAGSFADYESAARAERVIFQAELLHSLLKQHEKTAEAQAAGSALAQGSMEWYRAHKHEPIAPGSKLTIFEAAYCLLRIKFDGTMTDRSFDDLMYFISEGGVLPEDNQMPQWAATPLIAMCTVFSATLCVGALADRRRHGRHCSTHADLG